MAKKGLLLSSKFNRLCALLRLESEAHVVGHLEVLWNSAHEKKSPILGDFDSIEGAAKWPFTRERHQFAAAMLKTGFVDEILPGLYAIHDYYDHAPEYRKKLISAAAKHDPTICRETFYLGIDAFQKVIDEHEGRRKKEGHSTAPEEIGAGTVESLPVFRKISAVPPSLTPVSPEISVQSCLVRSGLASSPPPSSPPSSFTRRQSPEISSPTSHPTEPKLLAVIGRVTDAIVHLSATAAGGDEEAAALLENEAMACRSFEDWTALADIAAEALQKSTAPTEATA